MKNTINSLKLILTALVISIAVIACSTKETKNKKIIPTERGNLTFSFENGMAILSGTLSRSTPCVNWTVEVDGAKDLPRSQIYISIINRNKAQICIQVLGKPQEINAKIGDISKDTHYVVKLEDKELFSGMLNDK